MQATDNNTHSTNTANYESRGLFREGIKAYSHMDFLQTWVFKSSLIASFILTVLAAFCLYYFQSDTELVNLLKVFLPLSLQITVTLAALSLAGMAILVTTEADSNFVKFLAENNLYRDILFLFAEPLFIVIINLFTATISLFVVYTFVSLHWGISILLVLINGFMFLYTTLTFIHLYEIYAMYGQERCHYDKTVKGESISEKEEE